MTVMKKWLLTGIFFSLASISFLKLAVVAPVLAEDCEKISCTSTDDPSKVADYKACLVRKTSCLQAKIAETQSQKATLTNTINIMNSKIMVQQIQINQTQAEIGSLEREISDLSERISGLNLSLDKLTALLVERVREQYKQSRVSPYNAIFEADSFSDLVSRMEYLSKASGQTAQGMQRAELQKILYDQEKDLKQKKQDEVEQKKQELVSQKSELDQQKLEQTNLLKVTNNNEARYQQLLAEAQAQIDSFKSFVSSSGGGSIISPDGLGKGYDGNYFSQRDSRWANTNIGGSREIIYNVGCLITSIAMVLKAQGVDTNPGAIARTSSYFFANTAYMLSRSSLSLPGGKTDRKISLSDINGQLEGGHAVIIGLKYGPYGTHFVVLKKKDGDAWIMYDPFYGPDLKFTSRYSVGQIYSAEVIS